MPTDPISTERYDLIGGPTVRSWELWDHDSESGRAVFYTVRNGNYIFLEAPDDCSEATISVQGQENVIDILRRGVIREP